MVEKLGVEIRYLFNSGFALQKGRRLFIFDYYNFTPYKKVRGLDGGVVIPSDIRDMDVTVFASHAHMDHFTSAVLKWDREVPNIRYVLSHDISYGSVPRSVIKAYPDHLYDVDGLQIRTLRSTDEGVAFVIKADGLSIYHAGDLNWWHWEGEPEDENSAMAAAYKKEIDKLCGETFDIAFIPVDPRLEKQYLWGLDYFMKKADAKVIVPMHFRNSYSVFDRLEKDPAARDYIDRVLHISHRGEKFEV